MSAQANKIPGRLTRRSDFLRVRDADTRWVSPTVIVQAAPAATDSVQVGFTTTKKIGNAVKRNRARRRMREAARIVLAGASVRDIVLIGRTETATCPFAQLVRDLRWSLRRLEIVP